MADYGSGQTAPTNTQVRPPKEKQARQGSSFWNTVGQSLSQAMTSDAPQGVRVPKLVSRTRKEAVQLLERAELRLGEETSEPSDKPAGTVLGQSRKAGSRVPAGTFVNIVLARARPSEAPGASSVVPSSPPFIVVPNLDGESFERARKRLSDIGLTTGAVSYRKSKSPPGTVVGQDPAPGRRVAPGSGVALSVSPPNLTPGLSADRTNPKKGDQVTFTISVPPKAARLSGLKYRVDFGDGQKSDWTGATRLVHTYGASGTFPARASSMLDTQETWDGAPLEISVAGSLPAGWFGAALAALAVLGALLRWLKRPTPDPQPFHPGLTVKARLGTDPGVQSIHSELPLVPLPAIGLHFSRGKSAVTIVPAYEHGLEQQGGRTHDEREDQG
jgi:beta-lactam-binding protein with PASTA domain